MTTPTPLQQAILKANREQYGSRCATPAPALRDRIEKALEGDTRIAGKIPAKRNRRSSFFEIELAYLLKRTKGIPAFECNAKIIPDRGFEFDFVWRKEKVALELEGAIWQRGGGGHSHPVGILRDMEKANLAALACYRLLRFSVEHHKRGEIVPFLIRFFS